MKLIGPPRRSELYVDLLSNDDIRNCRMTVVTVNSSSSSGKDWHVRPMRVES